MDGFDHLEKVRKTALQVLQDSGSAEHGRFVKACTELKLPLNRSKRLVRGLLGPLLGGELDGLLGLLMQARDKSMKFVAKALAVLCFRLLVCARRVWPLPVPTEQSSIMNMQTPVELTSQSLMAELKLKDEQDVACEARLGLDKFENDDGTFQCMLQMMLRKHLDGMGDILPVEDATQVFTRVSWPR